MKLSDYKFSENDIKQLQDYRDQQKDFRLKLRFMAILSAALNKDGIGADMKTLRLFSENILKQLKIGCLNI